MRPLSTATKAASLLFSLCVIAFVRCKSYDATGRRFEFDPELRKFVVNGEPIRLISGSIHYFRIPAEYWNDRLKKIRAGGFNAIQVRNLARTVTSKSKLLKPF